MLTLQTELQCFLGAPSRVEDARQATDGDETETGIKGCLVCGPDRKCVSESHHLRLEDERERERKEIRKKKTNTTHWQILAYHDTPSHMACEI